MERRNSRDSTLSQRESVHDVFDDEHEVDFNEDDFMVSDGLGFRQTHANTEESRNGHPRESDRSDMPQRQYSTSKAPAADLRRTATRNSTAKVRNSTVQDGRPSGLSNQPPVTQSPLHHRDSVSSTASFATTSNSENPFETGPSHPYGMYPQHTMDRSGSIASASTAREGRPMSMQRPAHPYTMYSQSGLDDETSSVRAMHAIQPTIPPIQTAMPVGFPGLNNGYHRVLGPDGEEQDIIGPDGHTEQLPPYSRYPDEGPTKASMAAEASASRIVPAPLNSAMDPEDPFHTPTSPVSPVSEASFSAHALPAAAAAAAEPLLPTIAPARLPPQRPETQTGNLAHTSSTNTVPAEPSDSSSASLLTAESGEYTEKFNEKGDPESEKLSWRKKRLFGKIPMGVALVILILLLVFAVALGAAIGTFAAKKHSSNNDNDGHRPEKEPQPQVTGPSGSLFGATPISTPNGFSTLPTGAFSLPLGFPQEANPGCLVQPNEFSAWSCKMTFAPVIITINDTAVDFDGNMQQIASLRAGASLDGIIQYGVQTPQLDLQALQLVQDLDYKNYGPAYHFHTKYDKVVVLRAEELSVGSNLKKRQSTDDMSSRQRFTVQPGDYPWYCYWNDTYIEGYVYAVNNSTAATFTPLSTTLSSDTSSSTTSDTATFAAATLPPTTSPTTLPTAPAEVVPTPSVITRRDAAADAAASSRIPPYPRVVKIEERRLPDSPQPYCQRMVLLDNGKIAPALSSNTPVFMLWLQEQDPSYGEYFPAMPTATAQSKRDVERRNDPSDSCHCQWMFK
ncbi:hypothetical protein E8E13_001860 [Curvularia kusanoi]|uniref:DUF7820 domain-containing protein n=1 Tax=Curvularia kusanoi TaxID=90978 RepID=A0A9P4TKP5_CURKU|nr:hypothetical protein E8E13_001860 [Curvularia kusanoi]